MATHAFPHFGPDAIFGYPAFSQTWVPLPSSHAQGPRQFLISTRRLVPDGFTSDASVGSSTPGCSTASSGNTPTTPLSPCAHHTSRLRDHPFSATSSDAGEPHASAASAAEAVPARAHRHQHNSLYKTELCRSWEETGTCRYNAKCQFAHGREELRPVRHHPKYKTEVCESFARTGTCPYGKRCRFIHLSASLAALGHDAAAPAAAPAPAAAAGPVGRDGAAEEADVLAALLRDLALGASGAPAVAVKEGARRRLPIFESISGCA